MSLGKLTGFQGSYFVCEGEEGMLVVGVCVTINKYICDPSQQNRVVFCYQEKCDIPFI